MNPGGEVFVFGTARPEFGHRRSRRARSSDCQAEEPRRKVPSRRPNLASLPFRAGMIGRAAPARSSAPAEIRPVAM